MLGYVLRQTEKFYRDTTLAWLVWEKYAPMLEQSQTLRKILPHEGEKQQFYTKLHQTGMDSAILRITPAFCKRFILSVAEIRTALFNFYHEKYEQLLYHELIDVCVEEYMKININTNEVQLIEKKR